MFIPNIISPNGDDVNDVFVISGNHTDVRILKVSIYDRWGNMVFHADHYQLGDIINAWDGSTKGEKLGQGVFAYKIIVERNGKGQEIIHGDITLIK